MALKLRYNDKSIVLADGQLVVGRSVECNVVLNDPLASRRHAVISVGKSGAFVTDLGSKSGVFVNGTMISGARKLATGDTLQLASVEILVETVHGDEEPPDPKLRTTLSPPAFTTVPAAFRLAPTPALGIARVETYRARAETIADDDGDDSEVDLARTAEAPRAATADTRQPPSARGPDSTARPGSNRRTAPAPDSRPQSSRRGPGEDELHIAKLPALPSFPRPEKLRSLAVLAEKALAMNRPQEAERVIVRSLHDTLEAARQGDLDASTLELAASLGAKLASALGSGRWFDYAVELYAARADLMPAPVVDLLFAAVRKAKPIDKAAFRQYLARARAAAGDSPARRFVVQRLEGVQRLLDLK